MTYKSVDISRCKALSLIVLFFAILARMREGIKKKNLSEPTDGGFYTAGVVEFRQAIGQDSNENLADNLAGYLELIESPDARTADIIVFPELTLNDMETLTFLPKPEQSLSPCVDDPIARYYAPFLVSISCAARKASKYIVINICERQLCSATPEDTRPCAPTGYNVFNTNVVFNRKGTIISRYRKIHLYGEPRNSTFVPEPMSFKTDFGVTFGHFICFDILFYDPAHEMLLEQGVRDFIYPTMWFSQLPFLTAAQVQLGWAYSNDVNLLAAGASHPEFGSTGTGIYNGRAGTITGVMKWGEGERRIYVAKVPKYQMAKNIKAQRPQRSLKARLERKMRQGRNSGILMKRDYLEQYESVWLEQLYQQTDGNLKQKVCHGMLCCNFELQWRQLPEGTADNNFYGFRLGVYDGWRNEQQVDANYVRNCAIFACSGPDIEDCGQVLDTMQSRVNFKRIIIEAMYPRSREFLLMPNSVLDNFLPLEPPQFKWSMVERAVSNQISVRFGLTDSVQLSNLLTFAIYGNYYDDNCTFGKGTPEEDRECGYLATGGGAAALRSIGFKWYVLLALGLVCNLSS
ncbi:vanin-like protein 2 isoform X2 [Drosophila virilis]|uniref:vanin-like protein 2 isoform X2 n=1 Tax=Drosophila virilis TaxID=7244 RepID=UPI001396591A|nr:vanin-like protein 2 isoform X2 [Drosophila virilis]